MKRPLHLLFPVRKARVSGLHGHAKAVQGRARREVLASVASIGRIASPSQGVSYYEKDGPAHREARAWAGKGAEAPRLSSPVEPEAFRGFLEGEVPGGRRLGRRDLNGNIHHRPGRDVTLSAPKSVSLMALVGGDERIVAAHDRAVGKTLAWVERNAVETRKQDKASGAMVRVGGQKMVAATFRHDTSRNLDHSSIHMR